MMRLTSASAFVLETMSPRTRTMRRVAHGSAPGMLSRRTRMGNRREMSRSPGGPLGARPTAPTTDRRSTGSWRSLRGLSGQPPATRGGTRGSAAIGHHPPTPPTMSPPITATSSPHRRPPARSRCTWTTTGPQMRTPSPSSHPRSLAELTATPFRTDWE